MDLPDFEERVLILQIQAKRMPFEDEKICTELADATDGYSAAELVALCQRAGIVGLESDIFCKKVQFLVFICSDNPRAFCLCA